MRAYVGIFGAQAKVGSAAGVSRITVSRWLSGERKPNAQALAKLKRAAARLSGDVSAGRAPAAPAPTSTRTAAPAPAGATVLSSAATPDDEPDAGDDRPRGLYVVGGLGSAASSPTGTPPQPQRPSSSPSPELPGWLRKAKQAASDIKPLTKAEGERLRDSTVRSFQQFWKYADEGISATNAQRATAHIWSTVDREETEIIVDFLIQRGMQSAAAAQIVRGVSNIWNYYAVGLILAPRFVASFKFYVEHGGIRL